jgi:hypothetical protein
MARNLVVSFLSSLPPSVAASFAEKPLQVSCPVTQAGNCEVPLPSKNCTKTPPGQTPLPGGRAGYAQWLSNMAVGGKIIPGLARAAGLAPGEKIGRVCVMGFSNGCIGVDEVLKYDDSAKIDTVICCDGVHGSWGPGNIVQPFQYKNHINHAISVMQQNPDADPSARVMVITHSSIVPGLMPSTTQTADAIWNEAMTMAPPDYVSLDCGEACAPVRHIYDMLGAHPGPVSLCASACPSPGKAPSYSLVSDCAAECPVCAGCGCCAAWASLEDAFYDRRVANNFYVLGWGDLGGPVAKTRDKYAYADHHHQARVVLPALLQEFLVKRWNRSCTGPVSGFGVDEGDVGVCKPEEGIEYDSSTEQKVDYVPDLTPSTPSIAPCPVPDAGEIMTGSRVDRCAAQQGGSQFVAPARNAVLTGPQVLAALAALGVGYAAVRYRKEIWQRLQRGRR